MKLHVLSIKKLMGSKGMTQAQLASLMGTSPAVVSKILRTGSCYPVNAVKIADALNVDIEEIVKED